MTDNFFLTLPARARQGVYIVYLGLVTATGVVDAYCGDLDPYWLPAVLRALNYLSVPVLALAATHVTAGTDEQAGLRRDDTRP